MTLTPKQQATITSVFKKYHHEGMLEDRLEKLMDNVSFLVNSAQKYLPPNPTTKEIKADLHRLHKALEMLSHAGWEAILYNAYYIGTKAQVNEIYKARSLLLKASEPNAGERFTTTPHMGPQDRRERFAGLMEGLAAAYNIATGLAPTPKNINRKKRMKKSTKKTKAVVITPAPKNKGMFEDFVYAVYVIVIEPSDEKRTPDFLKALRTPCFLKDFRRTIELGIKHWKMYSASGYEYFKEPPGVSG
jgi:hypothetical protein